MTHKEKADMLDWITTQDRLRIETWRHMGGRTVVSVYTIADDDVPAGRGPTVIKALLQARQNCGRN